MIIIQVIQKITYSSWTVTNKERKPSVLLMIDKKNKEKYLDKGVFGHMVPQTLFACLCMHDGHNIKLYYMYLFSLCESEFLPS